MSKSPLVSPPCGATPVPSRPTYLPEAEAIPPAERLQQKQTKDGKFSLTSSALFWKDHQTLHKLVVILCSHFECEVVGERGMRAHVLISYCCGLSQVCIVCGGKRSTSPPLKLPKLRHMPVSLASVGVPWGGSPHRGPIGPRVTVAKFWGCIGLCTCSLASPLSTATGPSKSG